MDLQIDEGEFVAVFGPSGCRKTTLLQVLGGLDRPAQELWTIMDDPSEARIGEAPDPERTGKVEALSEGLGREAADLALLVNGSSRRVAKCGNFRSESIPRQSMTEESNNVKKRVLIVDDQPVFRFGLAGLITEQSRYDVGTPFRLHLTVNRSQQRLQLFSSVEKP